MQKLYIPWSLKARFTTGKIYFLGAKPYLLKTNVWQGCPSGFSKCEFSHVQTWTHGHISTAAEPEDAGRCWCPQMSVAAPGPLPWLLCSCQSVRPALFRAWQLEPLLRMPSAGGHSPGGGPLANEGWYRNAKAQLLPLKKYKLRGVVSTLERPRMIKQKLGLCWKSLLHLVLSVPSLSPPLLHLFLWEILPSHTVGPRAETFSPVLLFVTLWTIAHQAPLSTGFSRQGYWSGYMPSSGRSSWPRDWTQVSCIAGEFCTTLPPGKPPSHINCMQILNSGSTS